MKKFKIIKKPNHEVISHVAAAASVVDESGPSFRLIDFSKPAPVSLFLAREGARSLFQLTGW